MPRTPVSICHGSRANIVQMMSQTTMTGKGSMEKVYARPSEYRGPKSGLLCQEQGFWHPFKRAMGSHIFAFYFLAGASGQPSRLKMEKLFDAQLQESFGMGLGVCFALP